ncbi:MAG: hypothetical protein QM790_07695 [Nibricoccus sp.]
MNEPVPLIARVLITLATLAYGYGPFIVDMNKTHLLHPAWPGHARYHLMWASVSQAAVAGIALWLVWAEAPNALWRCRLGGVIGLAMTSGFFGALLTKKLFRGTLHDPQGIHPIAGKIDGNLIAVIGIASLLAAGLVLTG